MVDFCYDSLGSNIGLGYPNLAQPDLSPDQFDTTWPRVLPLRLLMYMQQFGLPFGAYLVQSAPLAAWYPVALAWHDFDCDYFDLVSDAAKNRARKGEIRFLFYYHEGDHPGRIKQRFDGLCEKHFLPRSCYLFVSANSSANRYENFYYFDDHEYFLGYINRRQTAVLADDAMRSYDFTALSRIHKWWRAAVMSDLHHSKLLDRSLWSYNTTLMENDSFKNNPIRLDDPADWHDRLHHFVAQGPHVCDSTDLTSHNDHRHINTDLYHNSYCHLVLETLFDVDQSGGTFLTEKTYKCIKFGQPFVIIGPVGSLEVLRASGYRIFDHMIDNNYDRIVDNTERWWAVRKTISDIKNQDMHQWYLGCLEDVQHNQWNFATKNHGALDRLVHRLTTHNHAI